MAGSFHGAPAPGGYPPAGSFHGAPAPGGYPPAGSFHGAPAPGGYPPAGSFHGAPAPGGYPPAGSFHGAPAPGGYPPAGSFHGAPAPAAPQVPPHTMQMLQQFWMTADNDRSGSISVPELATLPFPGNGPYAGKPIGPAAAHMLIQTFDATRTGQLNWDNFCTLFLWLERMQFNFYTADKDRGGTLDIGEVPAALYACGYQLPPPELQGYVQKHATHGHLNFVQFMSLVLDLQNRGRASPVTPYVAAGGVPSAHAVGVGYAGSSHGSSGSHKKGKDKKGKDKKVKDKKAKGKDKKKGGGGSGWADAGLEIGGAVAEGCASS